MTIRDTTRNLDGEYIVIFDPSGGFVTGGGWINSPPGQRRSNPSAIGKANFGFVSKYKKGSNVPEGETEFQFKAGDLNFHSSAYDPGSLVVSAGKAQYRGTGTINGVAGYKFVLTAYDGQGPGGGGVDRFRIKITSGGRYLRQQDGCPRRHGPGRPDGHQRRQHRHSQVRLRSIDDERVHL